MAITAFVSCLGCHCVLFEPPACLAWAGTVSGLGHRSARIGPALYPTRLALCPARVGVLPCLSRRFARLAPALRPPWPPLCPARTSTPCGLTGASPRSGQHSQLNMFSIDRYRSPVSGRTANTLFPVPSSSAIWTAATVAAPEEMPAKMPSSLAKREAIANASSDFT